VQFSGLAPGLLGVYQVNILIPPNAPAGDAVPVALSIGGAASNTVSIAIQ
jgi:minor extracellular serine protease Vpr